MTNLHRAALSVLLLGGGALLPGCLSSSEVQCVSGTVRCGDTCVAIQTDNSNCGSCGSACSGGNVCVAGACVCPVGQAICNGVCTAVATDPNNCGSCGLQCDQGQGQACNQGICQDCSQGGCRTALIAGCIARPGGYLQRIQDAPGGLLLEAAANPVDATFPDSLGLLGGALLYADDDSSTLFEIPIGSLSQASTERKSLVGAQGGTAGTAQVHTEVVDGGSRIYTMASSANVLKIFGGPSPAQAGALLDAGSGAVGALGLQELGGFDFPQGSFPEPFGKIGNDIFVPLNGLGTVVRVDVSDPAHPAMKDSYDLQPIISALPGGVLPDGGIFNPSPTMAIARNGFVYVSANVLRYDASRNASDYGPGVVVRIDPTKSGQSALSVVAGLGGDAGTCQNVEWLTSLSLGSGSSPMLVSCAGARLYGPPDFNVISAPNTALLLLDGNDHQITSWSPSNPPVQPDGGPPPASVGRAVAQNTTVYVADESASRLYVLDYASNAFVERVGFVDGGTAPQICPDYIIDLLVTPAP